MNKNPILITGAMSSELEILISKLEDSVFKLENSFEIYEGTIKSYPIVILKTKVGVINTAISLTMAIQKYKPIAIVNEGTSGSHEYNIHKFDLIIGESVVNINSMKTGVRQLGRGMNPFDWKIQEFHTGAEDEWIIYNADKDMVELSEDIQSKYQYGNVYTGRIGSGDVWNREVDRISWLNKNFKTSCEEMESVSIYKLANMFNIPVISFKVISNNEMTGEKFDIETSKACQEFTYEFIKTYINNMN